MENIDGDKQATRKMVGKTRLEKGTVITANEKGNQQL